MILSRLRCPVSLGAITGPVEMDVQKKDCRPHYPVRTDTADPRGIHAQTLRTEIAKTTSHTNRISKLNDRANLQNTSIPTASQGGTGGPRRRRCERFLDADRALEWWISDTMAPQVSDEIPVRIVVRHDEQPCALVN